MRPKGPPGRDKPVDGTGQARPLRRLFGHVGNPSAAAWATGRDKPVPYGASIKRKRTPQTFTLVIRHVGIALPGGG